MTKESLKSLLKNRDFLFMQFGMIISRVGTFMQDVAIHWQLYQLTKSPVSLGLLGLAKFIPVFFFSFFAGIVADTFNRKKVIFLVQLIYIISTVFLIYLSVTDKITPLFIYLIVGVDSILYAFESPARQAMGPTIIGKKDYPLAVNIMNIFYQSTLFIGPAIAGFVIAFSGIVEVYLVNAFSFLAVIIALFLMKPLPLLEKKPEFSFSEIKEGLRFVFRTPLIKSSMYIDFFATFFGSASTLMPIFAVDILKVNAQAMGFLYAAPSVGAILVGVLFPFINKIRSKGKLLVLSVIFYGLSMIFFGLSRNYYLSLFFIGLSGAGDMVSVIIRNVARQLNTPDHLRGRMISINQVFYSGGPWLGEVEAGFAAKLLGTPFSVALGGIATIFATVYVAVKNPVLLEYKD